MISDKGADEMWSAVLLGGLAARWLVEDPDYDCRSAPAGEYSWLDEDGATILRRSAFLQRGFNIDAAGENNESAVCISPIIDF